MEDRLSNLTGIIADILRSVPGVATATDSMPEQPSPYDFPAIAVYPFRGTAGFHTHRGEGLPTVLLTHMIVIDIHVSRVEENLGPAILKGRGMLIPVLNSLFKAWINTKFNGLAEFIGDPSSRSKDAITYEFSKLGWGTVETVGYRLKLDVGLTEEVS